MQYLSGCGRPLITPGTMTILIHSKLSKNHPRRPGVLIVPYCILHVILVIRDQQCIRIMEGCPDSLNFPCYLLKLEGQSTFELRNHKEQLTPTERQALFDQDQEEQIEGTMYRPPKVTAGQLVIIGRGRINSACEKIQIERNVEKLKKISRTNIVSEV